MVHQGPPSLGVPSPTQPPLGSLFPAARLTTRKPGHSDWRGQKGFSGGRNALASNRSFPNFIGFLSNPLQNIDPRSLTQVVPIFGSSWVSTTPALPDLNAQIYGPAVSLALTDRLCVGVNQGGLAFV